jgi:hypothetical protein
MPHPIYGPPSHELETVTFRLTIPTRRNNRTTALEVHGRTSTQRSHLWYIHETWTPAEIEHGLQASDAIHHLALIALQDHPSSQAQVESCLTGQPWSQLELPF